VVLAGAVFLMAGFVVSNTMNSVYALGLIALSCPIYFARMLIGRAR
jgi:hypothetical protein